MSYIPRDPWPDRPQRGPGSFLSPEHEAFCRARQAMHLCFLEWLNTSPTPADLDAEMAPVPNVLEQLRAVMQVRL